MPAFQMKTQKNFGVVGGLGILNRFIFDPKEGNGDGLDLGGCSIFKFSSLTKLLNIPLMIEELHKFNFLPCEIKDVQVCYKGVSLHLNQGHHTP